MAVDTTLQAVNEMDAADFVETLGWVFEGSPWVAERVVGARPFASVEALHGAMARAVEQASREEQLALIRAHPDLAARVRLSESSTAEQAGAGLDRLSADEYARFQDLNGRYRTRFGFPFVIAVRHHSKASILDAFERRLANPVDVEITTALGEIAEIARFRLRDAVR